MTTLAELVALRRRWKREGRSVALANGCFDLLHPGHVTLLEAARAQAEVLIVALNSDRRTHYRYVHRVLDEMKKAEAVRVSFTARPRGPGS